MAPHIAETAALLAPDGVHGQEVVQVEVYGTASEDVAKREPDLETTWRYESKLLFKFSAPLCVTYALQYSLQTTVAIVAGRLGTNELGAISLAQMTANVTGMAMYEGLATSLDTLCSQAYGAGKKELVGLHVQRMAYFMMLVTIPVGIAWTCSPWILELIVPEKEIAHLAGRYLRYLLIGAPGYAIFEGGKRFVQAQGDFIGPLAVLCVSAPLNVFLNYLFVFKLQLGFIGGPLSVSVCNNLQPIILALYVRFISPKTLQCWPGLSRAAFRNWMPMIRLALPGVMMTFCEWLSFDILTFSASYLSAAHLAAQSIIFTVMIVMYHLPFPTSVAASTRFGNLIGFGALRAARVAARTYTVIFICIGFMDMVILASCKSYIPFIFSKDPDVWAIAAKVMPIVSAAQFFDATTALANGLVRGLGRQSVGGWINLATYYIFAVPLALFLAFGPPKLGLTGLWIGPCSGLAMITFLEGAFVKWSSWQRAVDDARSREE